VRRARISKNGVERIESWDHPMVNSDRRIHTMSRVDAFWSLGARERIGGKVNMSSAACILNDSIVLLFPMYIYVNRLSKLSGLLVTKQFPSHFLFVQQTSEIRIFRCRLVRLDAFPHIFPGRSTAGSYPICVPSFISGLANDSRLPFFCDNEHPPTIGQVCNT
jgi:hypothetical protein